MSSIIYGHGYSPEEIARGTEKLHRAEAWRSANPTAWACVVRHALDLAAMGQPISAQALIESVRMKGFVDCYGNDTRTNNSFASIIARWLAREYPQTARYIRLRRSVHDVLMGGVCDD